MTKLFGSLTFLLQAAIVIAIVLVFSFFDPFGLLTSTSLKLKDTPVDVRSIKDMGQLITAEYYGEVVRSYAYQIREENIKEVEEVENELTGLHLYFWETIKELHEKYAAKPRQLSKRAIFSEYEKLMAEYLSQDDYSLYLYYTYKKIAGNERYKIKHLDNELKQGKAERFIKALVKDYEEGDEPEDNFLDDLVGTYDASLKQAEQKQTKKSNLVMLGRGWVKAGFDFGTFTPDNFRYNADNSSVFFIGFQPQILSATINPWFIPEQGIEGFEFLIVERKVRRDYKVVQKVKQMCLDELKRKALVDRQILHLAVDNAKQNMKEFFTLLLDKPVEQVVFYENELDFAFDEITKNDSIVGEELVMIDLLLRKDRITGVDSASTDQKKLDFIASIQNWLEKGKERYLYPVGNKTDIGRLTWQPEYAMLYEVVKDGIYSQWSDDGVIKGFQSFYCENDYVEGDYDWTSSSGEILNRRLTDAIEMLALKSTDTTSSLSKYIRNVNNYAYLGESGSIVWPLEDRQVPNPANQAQTITTRGESFDESVFLQRLSTVQAMVHSVTRDTLWVDPIVDSQGSVLGFRMETLEDNSRYKLFVSEDYRLGLTKCTESRSEPQS